MAATSTTAYESITVAPMAHRIREAWGEHGPQAPFFGPVEVDETYVGGWE